jgi:hypothetical protein
MFYFINDLIFQIKFWFKKRKLKKLDPYIYKVNKNDE